MLKKKKTFMSTNIRTAYHILVEESSNRSDPPLIFFSLLSLPSTVSSTINSHELNVFRCAESVKTFMSTNVSKAYHIQVEENSNRSDLSYLSATSLVFSSMLFLPPTVSSTTSSHVLNVVKHVEGIKNDHINHHYHSI